MIAILGGGISGLAVAYHLDRAGREFMVLEAAGRPGGVIRSERVEGRVLELGPQRTRLTAPFRLLVDALGLAERVITAPELDLFVHADGRLRLVPMTPRAALATDLIGWRDRARALLEPLTPGLREHETAAEFFTRKFGRRIYERIIAPLYGGLYASDPADMPARHALAQTLETLGVRGSLLRAAFRGSRGRSGAPACSFDHGLQVLVDALAGRLGERLRLGTPARAIRGRAGAYRVITDDDEVPADHVVLACPAGDAGRLLDPVAPGAAARLQRIRYNPLALVHLLADAGLRGLGYQVALGEGLATRGVTWNDAMFGRSGLHTAFLGGARRPDVPGLPDDELMALAAAEFETVTGAAARPIHVHRTWMPAWDRSWDALDGLDLPPGVSICSNWHARPGITGRLVEAERLARTLVGPVGGARS